MEINVLKLKLKLPVPLSSAVTLNIPFASSSNVTSICGMPLGAGLIPVRSNLPRRLLSLVIPRSPSNTCIVTVGWLSAAVEKICERLVGMVLPRGMSLLMTPPIVSIPRVSGLTSIRSARRSSCPPSTAACTAAP